MMDSSLILSSEFKKLYWFFLKKGPAGPQGIQGKAGPEGTIGIPGRVGPEGMQGPKGMAPSQ